MEKTLRIVGLKGSEMMPYIPDLAKLRIKIFKEYPYLYVGNLDYETDYLQTYVNCPESIVVLVFDHDKVVGASTAIPLEFETMEVKKPFLDHHFKIRELFYLGESVLQPEYRGRGVYRHFFNKREAAAKKYGCKITTFAAVERPQNDPRQPKDYHPLDNIWKHFGYNKHSELRTYFEWVEIGETVQSPKPLIFWLKNL